MIRSLATDSDAFSSRRAVVAVALAALAMTAGCQRGEPANPGGNAAAARPATRSAEDAETIVPGAVVKPPTARGVLERMIAAYRNASSYMDKGTVRFFAESDGKPIRDTTENFSLALVRPNKVHIRGAKAELVCDGRTLYAYVSDVPGQVFSRPAPERISMANVLPDKVVAIAMHSGIAGGLPQIALLFAPDPLKMLVHDLGEPELAESKPADGHQCYGVNFKSSDGITTFWIDEQTYILRRIVWPTDGLRELISQDVPVSKISLVADFTGAEFNGKVDAKAFQFEVPKDAPLVEFLTPPHMGQLLNKKVPQFKFTDLAGQAITPETTAGKTTVLAFWTVRYEPCRQMLKELDQVWQKHKDDPKVAFYAVCRDPSQFSNADMDKAIAELGIHVPVLRDFDASGAVFNLGEPPTTFIINDKGIVQHCEGGLNPKYAKSLEDKLGKVLAGEEIYQEAMKQYQEQVEELRQFAQSTKKDVPGREGGDGVVVKEETLPKAKIAPRNEPRVLKLTPAWKCADLKMPGNILVLDGSNGPERMLVIENGTSVAEVGLDGKLIALHPLELADKEGVGSLRSAVGADGHRYYVAFLVSQMRCHVFDENWKLVAHFPQDGLEHPHSGISDVRLGDLDGDGKLKMYVSYWGVVGVQAVSLDGNLIWRNRTAVSSVACLAIAADQKGRRHLFCADNSGALVVLDAHGQSSGAINIGNHRCFRIADADLNGDGKRLWCGLDATELGAATAIGFSLAGEELWSYPLPVGVPPQPIEPIIAGKLTHDGGQWLLPGPDGSIHILAADGKPLDRFNCGAVLQGLAAFETGGQPLLVVASPAGLEAWKVE